MKIIVNTRLLLKDKLEGIGWFAYESLKRITKQHPEHHFIFLFDRTFDEEFIFSDNITPIVIGPQARHPLLFYWWFEHSVTKILADLKADLFLSPDGYLSLSTKVPSLAVIHDLNFAHYPNDLPFLVRHYYNYFFPKFAHKAKRIATVSEYSKQDIIKQYYIPESKIDVVYNGANNIYKPIDNITKTEVKTKYTNGQDYFLFVGSLHPRKNIARLLQAFDEFKLAQHSAIKLVIVGEKYWWTKDIRYAYNNMKHQQDVIFTGRLSQENLKNVYGAALALTFIPYFEGFGIPIVEAMQCDTPVLTSNTTSMPEISGNAAYLVDPFSIDSIKNGMQEIAFNKELRCDLIEKSQIQRQLFSWDKTADKLWKCIEKTIY